MTRRLLLAALVLLALGAAAWGLRVAGPESVGGPARVDAGPVRVADLDGLTLERRIVNVSLTGSVVGEMGERTVEVDDGSGLVAVRLAGDHEVEVEDGLMVVGRLREQRDGRRWVEARDWARTTGRPVAASPEGRVDFVPDDSTRGDTLRAFSAAAMRGPADTSRAISERLGPAPDRSPATSDRSGADG